MQENEKLIRDEAEAIECLKSNKPTSGYLMLQESIDMAIQALEDVQKYRQICAAEVLEWATKLANLAKKCGTIGKVIDECAEYEEIGTVEEFRAAVEKQTAIEPEKVNIPRTSWTKAHMRYRCSCGSFLTAYDDYCNKCGQKLKWGDGK